MARVTLHPIKLTVFFSFPDICNECKIDGTAAHSCHVNHTIVP